jgi:asparagine synthase (glutamine-hydrolysing)
MGGLAAAITKHGEDAVKPVLLMLKELRHRGAQTIQIATPNSTIIGQTFQELRKQKISSNVIVGRNFSGTLPKESQQAVLKRRYTLTIEGFLIPPLKKLASLEIANELELTPQQKAAHIIKKFDGSYTFAIALPNKIIAGRDLLGASPFYIGQNEIVCALASERKALWALGIKQAKSFPPGNLASLTPRGFEFKPTETLTQPAQKIIDIEKAANRLQKLLSESINERIVDIEKIAVAFSGGLDSSIIATSLAKNCKKEVKLITVGLEGQSELRHAEIAAEALSLPLQIKTYKISDVEKAVGKVLWLIEEADPMKVGIAIPLFWTSQIASENGFNVLLSGQGADELFGGYHKYLKHYSRSGEEVRKVLFHDLVMSYKANFQRDNPICAFHEVNLRLPFIDRQVVQFALSLPLNLKILSTEDNLRKHVLRRVAHNLALPAFISEKTKKAVQYTTGVDKALRKLAQIKGLNLKGYVKQVFDEVYPTYRG